MGDLASFGMDMETDLSAFSAPPEEKSVVSASSDKTVAVQGALINGAEQELLSTFNKLSNLSPEERQTEMDILTDRVYQDNVRASQNIAAQMLLNPDMSPEESEVLVRSMGDMAKNKPNSMDLMAEQLGVKSSGDEDEVSEDIRLDAVELSREVNDTLRERQALLNGELLSTNKGSLNTVADFFEIIIPFSESFITEETVRKMRGGSVSAAAEAFSLLGNAKAGLRDYRAGLGHMEQREFDRRLAEVVNSAEGIVFTNDNDLAQKDLFMSIVDGTYYGDFDQQLDNVIGILDLVGLGGFLRGTKLGTKASALSKLASRKIRARVQPASPAKVAAEVNPEEARKMQAVAEADLSDETAQVTHGTTREEVIVDAEAPQVSAEDGSVENKPYDLGRYVEEFSENGRIDLSDSEILSAQRKLVDRVQKVNGITNRTNMAQFKAPSFSNKGEVAFQNVYGPADSSYKTPQEGIDNVLFALRDYGVEESDLTVLRRVGDEYVPTTVSEVEAKGVILDKIIESKFTPATKEVLDKVESDFILAKKEELLGEVGTRLERGDRKQLLKEKRQLEESLSKVVEESPTKVASKKGVPARKAKKDSIELAGRLTTEERNIFQDRLDLINSKLSASERGEVAEADLSRLEQGIIPERFKSELESLKKQRGTQGKVAQKTLPDELKKSNMRDDYLIRVNFQHDFDPNDISWDRLQVKRNFFDRIPFFNKAEKGSSSVQRHLLDIHSMLDPRLTLGANVAVEKASAIETALIRHADSFIKPFRNLDTERQTALMEVIKNDNFTGKRTSKRTLRAQGYSREEIELLDRWKEAWDQLYHLENRDLIKSLKAGGYQKFVDEANDTELVARKIGKANTGRVGLVYDSTSGELRRLGKGEIDELYNSGGTLAQLRSAEKLDGQDFEYVIVKNQQNQSMLREFQDSDRVLTYREGYYTVRYKDPHIITKEFLDEDGRVIRTQAVGTAATKKEAELAKANKNRGNNELNVRYKYRDNKDRTVGQMEDDAWQIHSATGRTSQRLRGDRLGTTGTNLQENALGAVEGPADALLNSIRSISRRTSMREYIERYKQRFMNDYEDLLSIDPNSGRLMFPASAKDFRVGEASTNKRLADARTNLEYINYLESGYRNTLDDTWKATLNGMADILGGKSAHAEKFIRATADEIQNPTTWFKARAFDAYLALNPLRQFVVQGHQASLLAATFPKYVLSQKMTKDLAAVHMSMIVGDKLKDVKGLNKLIGMSADEALSLAEEYRKTGFDASIDRNNLVENGLDHLVETERFKTVKKVNKAVVGTARKYGFDAGERINIMSSWLAHRNKALEQGKDITNLRVKDEILAKARNYTFNMNAAGDMPYNKNSLALLFQFMQVPHKAMLQVLNRGLSREDRLKLSIYNAVVLPMPVGLGYAIVSNLGIEDPEARDFIANGLEGYVFNKAAQLMFDDDARVDFSSLAAVDPNAPLDLIMGLLTQDVSEIFSNAPALSLWAGYNPRITNMITETYKFVTEPENLDAKSSLELMKTFASYSSGYMNLSKSYRELFVQEYDRRYNSTGMITDSSITTPEMIAKTFGFGSLSEAYTREAKTSLYEASQEARDDVKQIYLAQKQAGARAGLNVDDQEWQLHMLRGFWSATGLTEGQRREYLNLISRDIKQGDEGILGLILNNIDYVSPAKLKEVATGAGVSDEVGEIIQFIDENDGLGEGNE